MDEDVAKLSQLLGWLVAGTAFPSLFENSRSTFIVERRYFRWAMVFMFQRLMQKKGKDYLAGAGTVLAREACLTNETGDKER